MAYNGSKSLGTFYGYADGSRYGKYTPCTLSWSDVTRSGDTVTVNNLTLTMTHDGTGWTTYRFACKGNIQGTTTTTYANNYTLKAYEPSKESNPETIKVNFGKVSVKTLDSKVKCYIEIASTKGSTSWKNFASTNLEVNFDISCPPSYPVYTKAPFAVSYTETEVTLNRGTTDISSTFKYRELTEANKNNNDGWTDMSATTVKISSLAANSSHTYQFKAINALDSTYVSEIKEVTVTTYQYPYIQTIAKENLVAGETQTITLYNPCNREVDIKMLAANGKVLHEGQADGTSYSFILSNLEACRNVGVDQTEGTATYSGQYSTHQVIAPISKKYTIDIAKTAPVWRSNRLEDFVFYKDGSSTVDITQDSSVFVQQYSQLWYGVQYEPTETNANCGAVSNFFSEITDYHISINGGEWIKVAKNSTEADINSGYMIPEDANQISIRIQATDKRNQKTPVLETAIPVTQYKAPAGTVIASREGGYGETILIHVYPTWGVNQNSNAGTAQIFKITQDGQEIEIPEALIKTDFSTPFTLENKNNESRFTFWIRLTDKFLNKVELEPVTVGIGQPILFIDSEQIGVGVNCFPDSKGLYVNGETVLKDKATGTKMELNEFLIVGSHRQQGFTRNKEARTGWYYTGGE